MKSLLLRLLCIGLLGLLPVTLPAQSPAMDPYTKAVHDYVEAAVKQIDATRAQVDAVTKNAAETMKQAYAPVYQQLDRCDKLIARLKTADSSNFDRRKAYFEKALREMTELLEKVRKGK